jgi:hypothetical protein
MSYTMPQPQVNPPPDEERFSSVPGDNLGLISASAGSSTLEANRVYGQVRKALHGKGIF